MRLSICIIVALLLAVVVEIAECADDAPAVKAAPAKRKARAKVEDPPADALKPAKVDAKAQKAEEEAARARKAAEMVDLDAVAAPLRALFGGVAVENIELGIDVPPDVMQNDAMVQQFAQQNYPILRSELGFVRQVCSDLPIEQRPKIRRPAEAALKKAAKQMAKQQNQMQRGLGGVQAHSEEPGKLIREAIRKALKEVLNEQQMARFTEEAEHRAAARKHAAIMSLVSRLDGQLYLTEEQRDKISDSLSSKWQDSWEKWQTMMAMYGDRYFPTVPDQCVTPHLTPDQKVVWQSLQKIEFGFWWGGGVMQNLDADGWWGEEPAAPAAGVFQGGAIFITN